MNSYRIEKVRCPVTVVFTGGETIRGDIFLAPVSRFGSDTQDPAELLNDSDRYFAVAPGSGPAVLAAKRNVEWIEVARDEAALAPPAGPAPDVLSIQLVLVSGGTFAGEAVVETPRERPRLLDFLNAGRERFLRVLQPNRVLLVNRHAIAHVHELS